MELVDLKNSQTLWVPVTNTAELFVGSLVEWSGEGVDLVDTASGAFDVTGDTVLAGVVIGTDNATKVFEDGTTVTGFAGEEVTGLITKAGLAGRTTYRSGGGMYPKGDPLVLVQIAVIDPTTRLRAPIRNAAYGTGPTLLTVTTGSGTDALDCTTGSADATTVADFSTLYFRTGANRGSYRVLDSTSATTHTHDHPFKNDIAVGDTGVVVNLKQGYCRAQTDAQGLYFDISAAVTSDYWGIFIDYMDLRVANEEYCEFRFGANHFGGTHT